MELNCDYREKAAIKLIEKVKVSNPKYANIEIKSENLYLGDFTFGNVIIERKTHQDLASSILDGRYKEQCTRLQEYQQSNPSTKIIYIIEGNIDLFFNSHNIDKEKLKSAMVSLMYEKGFSVINSRSLNETIDFLLIFAYKYYSKYEKLQKNSPDEENNDITVNNNLNNIENLVKQGQRKKEQINRDNIGIMMLCNIPHISFNLACELLKPFENNIYKFICKLQEDSNYLYNLKIQGKNANSKERKLGKNIANTLYDFFGESQEVILTED